MQRPGPSVTPTAELVAPPPVAALAGTHPIPVQRQSPSGESAGLHSAPSHHQKPSAEKRVTGGGAPPCGPTMAPSIGCRFPPKGSARISPHHPTPQRGRLL